MFGGILFVQYRVSQLERIMNLEELEESVLQMVRETIEGAGMVLLDVEAVPGNPMVLRHVIDADGGATISDCAKISRALLDLLEEWEGITGKYSLEVTTPGLDRKIRRVEEYDYFRGRTVKVFADMEETGTREYSGVLDGMDGDDVLLKMEKETIRIPVDRIVKARLFFREAGKGKSGRES